MPSSCGCARPGLPPRLRKYAPARGMGVAKHPKTSPMLITPPAVQACDYGGAVGSCAQRSALARRSPTMARDKVNSGPRVHCNPGRLVSAPVVSTRIRRPRRKLSYEQSRVDVDVRCETCECEDVPRMPVQRPLHDVSPNDCYLPHAVPLACRAPRLGTRDI